MIIFHLADVEGESLSDLFTKSLMKTDFSLLDIDASALQLILEMTQSYVSKSVMVSCGQQSSLCSMIARLKFPLSNAGILDSSPTSRERSSGQSRSSRYIRRG